MRRTNRSEGETLIGQMFAMLRFFICRKKCSGFSNFEGDKKFYIFSSQPPISFHLLRAQGQPSAGAWRWQRALLPLLQAHWHLLRVRTELEPAAAQADSQLCPQGREAGEGARQRSGAFEQPRVRRLHWDDGGGQDCEAGRQQSDATQVVHDHSGVVTSGKNVQVGMRGNHPKAVVFSSESVETSTFGHVPNTNRLVFGIGHNQVLSGMEDDAGDVVVMTTTSVNFPGLQKKNMVKYETIHSATW